MTEKLRKGQTRGQRGRRKVKTMKIKIKMRDKQTMLLLHASVMCHR